jgi:hypothetical protein
MRILLAIGFLLMLLGGVALANSTLLLLGVGQGAAGGGGAPLGGALLLEDNASFVLLEDGVSDICFEGAAC